MPRFSDSSVPKMFMDAFADKEKRMAYDVSDNVEYVGYAQPGASTSDTVWYIQKMTYSSGNLTRVAIASDNADFAYAWDSRATYF